MEILYVPVIISLVYMIIEVLKLTFKSEKFLNFIPLISAALGGVLGILSFIYAPLIIPAENIFGALLIGIGSGLSATGSNQILKQLSKLNSNDNQNSVNP